MRCYRERIFADFAKKNVDDRDVYGCWSAYLALVIFHRNWRTKNGFTFCTEQKKRNFVNIEQLAQGRDIAAFT